MCAWSKWKQYTIFTVRPFFSYFVKCCCFLTVSVVFQTFHSLFLQGGTFDPVTQSWFTSKHTKDNLSEQGKLKGTSGFHKTVRVCHVYCNFKIGFTCRITVIFGTLKDGSLLINTLASNICFSYRNMFQNDIDALSKIVDAFLSKSSKFYLVQIIR